MTLQGHFGRARRPRLTSFSSRRLRRNLGAIPGPVLYTLTFDELTNRTCSYCFGNDSSYAATATSPWSFDAAKSAVDELFAFSVLLGNAYSGEWADASTFEVTIIDALVNATYGEMPVVGRTTANFTGLAALYNAPGRLPASTNELATLFGDPYELSADQAHTKTLPVLPHVAAFHLLDAGDGGLSLDGSFGVNATLLLTFNTTAHDVVGEQWRHEWVHENISYAFPGGEWHLAGEGDDPYDGVYSDADGLRFSTPLGERYRGEWLSREQLLVRVLELPKGGASSAPRVGELTVEIAFAGRTTPSATLQTQIGASVPPALVSATADDPDLLDYVYSSGDTVSIAFDRSTDRGGGTSSGNKAFVDALFAFTQPLAYDYSGEWGGSGLLDEDSVFKITILQATCPGCTPMPSIATVKPKDTAFIRTRAASSPRAYAPSPPLTGDYGKTFGPRIISFVADDFDNGDDVYGSGDTLTVVFDLATDRGGTDIKATSVDVTEMLSFSHSLGEDVLSQWRDDSTLVITIISGQGADDVLVGKTAVRPQRQVRNKGCCAAFTREGCALGLVCCCYNATDIEAVTLSGDFGNRAQPAIASFVGDDPDDGDAKYGAEDVLLVSFDMATDRGKGDPFGGKEWVDDLLWFSLPIGDDYSGEWVEEDKAITINILRAASTLSSLPEAVYACEQLPTSGQGGEGAPSPPPPPALPGAASACHDGVAPVTMLNVSDSYWRRTLVSARGDGYDNDGDGNGGDVRSRAGTSGAAGVPPILQGQLGNLGVPAIVKFVVEDPNNGDTVYGSGDVLTITLDRPVDRTDVSSDVSEYMGREAVDRLFSFTTPLGASYRGVWNDTSTFTIEIDDAADAGPVERSSTRVHASVRDDAFRLRNRAGCSGVPESSCLMPYVPPPPRLTGSFGLLPEPPMLVGAYLEDYDNADSVYSANDTITVRFDRPTDGGARTQRSGGAAFVDSLLNFSTPLGNDYVGSWSEDGTDFVVTTLDAGNGTISLEYIYDENNTLVQAPTLISVVGDVRSRGGNSPPSRVNLTTVLVGNVGDNSSSAFPRVISSVARETKRGELWTVTLGLDRATDRGRTRLNPDQCSPSFDYLQHDCVMQLFTITPADILTFPGPSFVYGQWMDDSTFAMTTTVDVATPGVKFGEGQEDNLQFGTTNYLYTAGVVVNGTQHCDMQPEFTQCEYMTRVDNPDVPKLVSFTVADADNFDAVLSVGDVYTLKFDVPTDSALCEPTCSGGKDYVHRLFTFSSPLATDYAGRWRDNATFDITVTRVDADFIAPVIAATVAALRPANAELQAFIEADLEPWLLQTGATYIELQDGSVPDRVQVRTANGLSEFATTACVALSLEGCDDADTGERPVPTLSGNYGILAAPRVVSFIADDPDNFDEVYSSGDTLTLSLDVVTDALLEPRAVQGDRLFCDELFAFSHSLGADYSGAWRDASTFVLRVLDVAGAGTPTMSGPCTAMNVSLAELPEDYCLYNRLVLPKLPPALPPGASGVPPPPPSRPSFAPAYVEWPPPVFAFFNSSASLRSVRGRSQSTREPVALEGSFGSFLPPRVLSWVAEDADNGDPSFSPGDTLTVTFDMRTAVTDAELLEPTGGGKAYVDALLEFSSSLGLDYSGHWSDASSLVVTAIDTADAAPPRIGLTKVSVRIGDHNITNEHGSSLGCMDDAMLAGSFGAKRPPQLLSVTIDDEDNGDEVYGYCDVLTFEFDMPTDTAGGTTSVYDLFSFANPVDDVATGAAACQVPFAGECPVYDITNGLAYTGAWSEDTTRYHMRMQCPAPPGTPTAAAANAYSGAIPAPYLVGNSTLTFLPYEIKVARLQLGVTRIRLRADVRNKARNLRQPLLTGEFGSVDEPYIVRYEASNYENADAVYGESDLLTITFDKPTDKAGGERYGLKLYVDGLFSFSEGDPADDYSGEWRDDSTFVVRAATSSGNARRAHAIPTHWHTRRSTRAHELNS